MNVLRPTLRIVNWNARMLFFGYSSEGFFQRQIARKRENIRPRNHGFTDGNVLQFQCAMNHFFLERRYLAELPAGGDDQLQLIGRVYRPLADLSRTEQP